MPYKKSKRMAKRTRRTYKRKIGSPSLYPGFPANKIVKMRYVESLNFAPSTSFQTFDFRANGVFDPYAGAGGHQPIGYDEWSLFYNHNVVVSSKIKVELASGHNANNNDTCLFCVYLADDATTASTILELAEQGKCAYRLVSGNTQTQKPFTLTNSYSAKKFFNVADVKDNLDRLGSAWGAVPSEEAIFRIALQGIYGVGTYTGAMQAVVTIEYTVLLSEPRELNQS